MLLWLVVTDGVSVTTVAASGYRAATPGFGAATRRRRACPSARVTSARRINGDGALTGYCYGGGKVFCIVYFQAKIPC